MTVGRIRFGLGQLYARDVAGAIEKLPVVVIPVYVLLTQLPPTTIPTPGFMAIDSAGKYPPIILLYSGEKYNGLTGVCQFTPSLDIEIVK